MLVGEDKIMMELVAPQLGDVVAEYTSTVEPMTKSDELNLEMGNLKGLAYIGLLLMKGDNICS